MFQVPRYNRLLSVSAALTIVSLSCSSAAARQWPVHGGPVNRAVPQYRGSYPLQPRIQTPTPTVPPQQPVLEFGTDAAGIGLSGNGMQPSPPGAVPPAASTPRQETAVAGAGATDRYPLSSTAEIVAQPVAEPFVAADADSGLKKRPPAQAKTRAQAKDRLDAQQRKIGEPVVRYDVYRDHNPLPIDPRKPFSPCTQGAQDSGCCGCGTRVCRGCDAPGLRGKPYQEAEMGGYACGKKKCGKNKTMFSQYWPRPFSAKLDEHFAQRASDRYRYPGKKSVVDVFDRFIDFKLVDYQRKDNGYCGEDSDPYGCLGESRMIASGVMGVGYRFPSVPVDRSAAKKSFWY